MLHAGAFGWGFWKPMLNWWRCKCECEGGDNSTSVPHITRSQSPNGNTDTFNTSIRQRPEAYDYGNRQTTVESHQSQPQPAPPGDSDMDPCVCFKCNAPALVQRQLFCHMCGERFQKKSVQVSKTSAQSRPRRSLEQDAA